MLLWTAAQGLGAGTGIIATSTDLTTLFVAHLAVLRATQPDVTTALAQDIPTVWSDPASQQKDANSDYFVYLGTHA